MSGRPHGLIIAIEQYDPQGTIPARLDGTADAARAFRSWLETKKGVDPTADIAECVSDDWPAPITSRTEIVKTLRKIMVDWQNQVSELYVYLAGHGLSQRQLPWLPGDYLLTSDFHDFETSGSACVPLQEMREKLWASLGPGDHYYFVDVCRTEAPPADIEMTNLGVKPNVSKLGMSAYCTLFSVRGGANAAVDSGFANAVLDGLAGRGRAKTWVAEKLAVTFDGLLAYVQKRIEPQEVDQNRKGVLKGVILPIDPVKGSQCSIEIDAATTADAFSLRVADLRGRQVKVHTFTGPKFGLELEPDDYILDVTGPGGVLPRIAPPRPPDNVDLYDDCTIRFRNVLTRAAPPLAFDDYTAFPGPEPPPETVFADTLRETARDLPSPIFEVKTSRAHSSIRSAVGRPREPLVDFSESMQGPVANQDLSLWLSILGASRIVNDPGIFSKLRKLSLSNFENVPPNGSAIYVLGGFELESSTVVADVDGRHAVPATKVKGLDHIVHRPIDAQAGPHLVTLGFGKPHNVRLTVATHCLPNRVTLLVFVRASDGRWIIRQLLLPLWTHHDLLDPFVQTAASGLQPLRMVQLSALAQTQFTRKHDVSETITAEDKQLWTNLLFGKWLDPVMSLLAAYDIIRRNAPIDLAAVVYNLRTYFPGIPDTESIASLAGLQSHTPAGVPLFLDGALAMPDLAPETLGRKQVLDYRTPWTMWIGPML